MTTEELKVSSQISDIIIQMIINPHLDQEFKTHMQETFPFLTDQIEDVYLNPNGSATNEIKTFTEENRQDISDCVLAFSKKTKTKVERVLDIFWETELTRYNLKGKALKTTTKKWPRFAYEIRNAIFDKFSVIKQNEDVYVFFV